MKVVIEKSILLKAMAHAQGVVEKKAVSPILSNVLLKAADHALTITATDLDVSVVESLKAKVEDEGVTTVSAHTFYEVVRKLPDGPIELSETTDTNQLSIKSGKSKFYLPVLPAKDFSTLKTANLPHSFSLKAAELKYLINSTSFAMSLEETRYTLNGIYLHTKSVDTGSVLRAVSTDGHRLALADMEEPKGAAGMPDVIIPRKTIVELSKLLEDATDEVEVSLSLTQITFSMNGIVLASRLIDGTFPDYEKVIPTDNDSVLTVDSKKFSAAVDRVATISDEKTRGVKLTVEPQKIIVSASSVDQGNATEEVEAIYTGKRLLVAFNVRYLLNIAQQLENDNLVFHLADESAPAIIKGGAGDGTLYVLMPMRL